MSTMSVSGVWRSKTWMSNPSSRSARIASSPSFSRGPPRRTQIFTPWSLSSALALRNPAMMPERLLYVGEVGDGAAHDDVPDSRQRADLLGQDLHGPVRRVAGVFRVVGQLAASGHHRVGIIDARATTGRQHRR